ncbi:MAG: glucosyl transferase [Ignavibacteriales bacterium]|nr:glucosyl transferase [Ignavibacteriales bacterium]
MVRLFGYFCCALFLLITSLSCDSSEPLVNSGTNLTLALEDSSSTELWLRLTSSNIPLPISISLNQTDSQNNTVVQTISLCWNDTLLYVDSLLPKQTYKFKAEATNYQLQPSNELTTATMDTTSHNFTWQSWTFGEHSSSVFYDVAIIDENNIWAVGEIYLYDSLGVPDPHAYNAVHWDGTEWELKRIYFYTICGQQSLSSYPAKAIWVVNENDIWIAVDGDQITRLENEVQTTKMCLPWSFVINKIWGTSSEDLYFVGNGGNIAHYGGPSVGWQKIESGTDVVINDVWGVTNAQNNYKKIFCAVSSGSQPGERKILIIDDNNKIDSLNWNTGKIVTSIWSENGSFIYTAGAGVFNNKSGSWIEETFEDFHYSNRIRGTALNDIFVGGNFGFLSHFNGKNWKEYEELLNPVITDLYSAEFKEGNVVTVGFEGTKALVLLGKRIQ